MKLKYSLVGALSGLILALALLAIPQSHSATSTAIFAPVKISSACDMATATCTSTTVDLTRTSQYSVQAWYTGSPVGSFQINVSNDPLTCSGTNTNWAIATGTSATAISAAGTVMYNVTYGNYQCLQTVYTKTSGTGNITVIYGSK